MWFGGGDEIDEDGIPVGQRRLYPRHPVFQNRHARIVLCEHDGAPTGNLRSHVPARVPAGIDEILLRVRQMGTPAPLDASILKAATGPPFSMA